MNESKYICNFEPFKGKTMTYMSHNHSYMINGENCWFGVYEIQLKDYIARGLITEVKPAVWTDDDMIEFGKEMKRHFGCFDTDLVFKDFKKEKGI